MRAIFLALFTSLWAISAAGQELPGYTSTTINDFADLLPQDMADRLSSDLQTLREETGIEMTVVTISSRATYGDNTSIESFATRLFNQWGVGDTDRNDGILVLVSPGDREMRVELGSGWDPIWDDRAKNVIDFHFLPYFRDAEYARGIDAGVTELIRRFSPGYVPVAGDDAPSGGGGGNDNWIFWIMAPVFALFIFGRRLLDQFVRLKRCPNCGARRLSREREIVRKATKAEQGQQDVTTRCANCDYRNVYHRPISYRSSSTSSSGSFGGGSSSGGGASGRW